MRLPNGTVIPKRDKTVLLLKVFPIIGTRLNHKDIYTCNRDINRVQLYPTALTVLVHVVSSSTLSSLEAV